MIQIDMEMPKCCDECFALDDHGDYPFCLISQDQRGYTFNVRKRRMPTCPLKAQEPRLMTADDFIDNPNADSEGFLPAWIEYRRDGEWAAYWDDQQDEWSTADGISNDGY